MPAEKLGQTLKDTGSEVQNNTSWRQTVRREIRTAQAFEPTWGFLKSQNSPQTARSVTRRSVKYVNPKGATWTLASKIVPAAPTGNDENRQAGQQLLHTIKQNGGKLPQRLNAERAAGLTHAMRMEHIKLRGTRFDTSNSAYGQRLNIEPFVMRPRRRVFDGVADIY